MQCFEFNSDYWFLVSNGVFFVVKFLIKEITYARVQQKVSFMYKWTGLPLVTNVIWYIYVLYLHGKKNTCICLFYFPQ